MKKLRLRYYFFIIFSLVFIELSLRCFKPVYYCNLSQQFRYDSELGVATKANLRKSILTDHLIEIFTNDLGSKNYLNKDDLLKYKKVVFCVGDSFTEGTGNLADQSYPFYLDLLLNRDKVTGIYEKNFAVINLGVGGYGSIQSYLISKIYTEKIGKVPDAIIYFICSNDSDDDLAFEAGYSHHFAIWGSPYHSYAEVILCKALENVELWKRFILLKWPLLNKSDKFRDARAKLKQFSKKDLSGLGELIDFSKKNNIKLIISYTDYASSEYENLKKFADKKNIQFADYKPDIESVIGGIPGLPVNNRHSGGHFRSWVNIIIADKFAAFLKSVSQ